jgi:hypothetical protein
MDEIDPQIKTNHLQVGKERLIDIAVVQCSKMDLDLDIHKITKIIVDR